jgi:hypothetical protein
MIRTRLSIRGLVLLVTACTVIFAIASQPAALVGILVGLLSVPAALLVQAAFFAAGSVFGRWLGPVDVVARTNRGGIEHSSLARTASRPPLGDPSSAAGGS